MDRTGGNVNAVGVMNSGLPAGDVITELNVTVKIATDGTRTDALAFSIESLSMPACDVNTAPSGTATNARDRKLTDANAVWAEFFGMPTSDVNPKRSGKTMDAMDMMRNDVSPQWTATDGESRGVAVRIKRTAERNESSSAGLTIGYDDYHGRVPHLSDEWLRRAMNC